MRVNEFQKKYIEERDKLIYSQAKIGEMPYTELAKVHRLSESAIRKIVKQQKEKEQTLDKIVRISYT